MHQSEEFTSKTSKAASLLPSERTVDNYGSFAVLPNEILLKIFKELDVKSRCRCSQINKHFRDIARDPFLWTRVNLEVDVETANIQRHDSLYTDFLNFLTPRCKYLQYLTIRFSVDEDGVTSKVVGEFLNACASSLTYLNVACTDAVDDSVVAIVSSTCQNLKVLDLSYCNNIQSKGFGSLAKLHFLERLSFDETNIETAELCSILRSNRQLRYLSLEGNSWMNLEIVAEQMSISCPHLESIAWSITEPLTSITLKTLERCSNLRNVQFLTSTGKPLFQENVQHTLFTNSRSLKWYRCSTRTPRQDIEPLMDNHLEELTLWNTNVTSDDCSRLLDRSPHLRVFSLQNCRTITDADIQNCRTLYPHVTIKT